MLDGYKNVREWRFWMRGGARWEKQCRFGGGMLRLWSVGCGMGHASREYFSHGSRRSTQKPFGLLVNNTDHAAGAADRRRSFRRWREIYMWSVENVECGVLNESRWMLNGFIMGSMGRRGCVFTVQKVITVSKNARQWGVWNSRNLIFVAKRRTDHRAAR